MYHSQSVFAVRPAAAGFVLVFVAYAGVGAVPQPDPAALSEGRRVERSIGPGSKESFDFDLAAGEFIHAVVEQRGVDVVAELSSSGNVVLLQDSPNGDFGIECVAYVAPAPGRYQLTISSFAGLPTARAGTFELRVIARRAARREDALHGEIEQALSVAQQLRSQNTGQSREKAIELFTRALRDADALGLEHEQSLAAHGIGLTHLRGGNAREAIPFIERAVAIFERAGSHMVASASTVLGGAFDILGDVRRARDYYRRALEQYGKAGIAAGQAIAHNNIGKLYADTAEWQLALAEYALALSLFRDAGDTARQAVTLYNIGVSHVSLGDFDRGIEYLRQSLDIRTKVKNVAGQAEALTNLGRAEMGRGANDAALDYLQRALAAHRIVGDSRSEGQTWIALSEVYLSAGNVERAREASETASMLLEPTGDRRYHAIALLTLARADAAASRYDAAFVAAQRALDAFVDLGDGNNSARALTAAAEAAKGLGRFDAALEYMERAMASLEGVRARVSSSDLRATYLARRYDTPNVYLELLMDLERRNPLGGYAARAFEINERARARSLADLLNEARVDITQGVDAALVNRERRVRDLMSVKSERLMPLLARDRSSEMAKSLLRELGSLEAEYDDVRAAIRKSNPAYASLTQSQPVDVRSAQRELDADTRLIEYALGTETSYAWVLGQDALRTVRLAPRRTIEAAAREAHDLVMARGVSTPGETAVQRQRRIAAADRSLPGALRRLSDLVIAPLGDLGDSRLLIVADGALQYIPFSMLPARAADGTVRPLVVGHEIVTMPSASVLAVQREQLKTRARPGAGIAVIADPVFDRTDARLARSSGRVAAAAASESSDVSRILEHISRPGPAASPTARPQSVIPRLPFTRNEADAILAAAKGQKNFRAVDFAATKEAVLGGALKNYRIVHFATHGFLDTERPTLSSIVLSLVDRNGNARDGFLRAQELYNLELNADLVVLSACQTGLGKSIEGEGLIGLTRGLMYAGAQRVVVSLWNVSDRATATLMSTFYRDMLTNGKTPSAALRAAQLEVMKIKGWENPYYWAPFVMQGDWR